MAEYIEREALHSSGYDVYDKYAHKSKSARDALLTMEELIKTAPTADVVEVRHGEWVGKKYNCYYRGAQPKVKLEDCHYLECSNCGNIHPLYTYDVWTNVLIRCAVFSEPLKIPNYCPNCGAKMDGKGDGE